MDGGHTEERAGWAGLASALRLSVAGNRRWEWQRRAARHEEAGGVALFRDEERRTRRTRRTREIDDGGCRSTRAGFVGPHDKMI